MYKVINFFTDLQDFEYPYNVGDTFPRDGIEVSEERLDELSSNRNKQGKPLIKHIESEMDESDNGAKRRSKRRRNADDFVAFQE